MFRNPRATPRDFFSDPAAQEAGFTAQFWHQAYHQACDEAQRDPDRSSDKYDRPRSIRMPFKEGQVNVIVRAQPESRDWRIVRLTAYSTVGRRTGEP